MILGPTIPNTVSSVRELVTRRTDLLETGLRLVCDGLVLGQDVLVDAFACDAGGAPVFILTVAPDDAGALPGRLLAARAWVRQNGSCLSSVAGDAGLRMDLPPRFFVAGIDHSAATLAELERLAMPGLRVLQFCFFAMRGRQQVGVTDLLAAAPGPAAAVPAEPPFQAPTGVSEAGQGDVCARFLDLVRRIDPRVVATGDRFRRWLTLGSQQLAEVGMQGGALVVSIAGDEPGPFELDDDSLLGLVDRLIRRVLALELGGAVSEAGTASLPADGGSARDRSPRLQPLSSSATAALDPRREPVMDRFSLEPIRRSVAAAQLSREEFSALGEEGS